MSAAELKRGFVVGDRLVQLVTWGRGIFKPKELTDGPLTLVSSMTSKYDDKRLDGDVLLYDYAPQKTNAWANEGLKRLAEHGRPVIWLEQVKKKPNPEYMIFAPVLILEFDDSARKFRLGLADAQVDVAGMAVPAPGAFAKAYAKTIAVARLHQARFRKDTLTAYQDQCAVCELRERPLLDAAHIVPDRLPESVPKVQNGLAMCPTHHRAFDQDFIAITEQYKINVDRKRLRYAQSPATVRMLLDFDQRTIVLPRDRKNWPSPEFLRRRVVA